MLSLMIRLKTGNGAFSAIVPMLWHATPASVILTAFGHSSLN